VGFVFSLTNIAADLIIGINQRSGTLLRKIHQYRWSNFQCPGKFDDIFEGNVALPPLDPAQITTSQSTLERQLLL
jgi:hypothetical protein